MFSKLAIATIVVIASLSSSMAATKNSVYVNGKYNRRRSRSDGPGAARPRPEPGPLIASSTTSAPPELPRGRSSIGRDFFCA
jgi:hypothetical protein